MLFISPKFCKSLISLTVQQSTSIPTISTNQWAVFQQAWYILSLVTPCHVNFSTFQAQPVSVICVAESMLLFQLASNLHAFLG